MNAILSALKKYADDSASPRFHQRMFADGSTPPSAELRLICQLAAGVDQLTASVAAGIGYKLHTVLPGSRAAFRQDIQRNLHSDTQVVAQKREPGLSGFGNAPSAQGLPREASSAGRVSNGAPDPVSQFERLLNGADRVLELDRDNDSSDQSPFTLRDYAQAGSIILDHSDVVLVVVPPRRPEAHDEPSPALGGTRWIEERAEERDLTVIRVPIERPFDALLIWTVDGRREDRRVFETDSQEINCHIFGAALDDWLLGPPFDPTKTRVGWLERRMIVQLDPEYNAREWDTRWKLASSDALVRHDLGRAPQQIDNDLKPAKVWADHRAGAMAQLVRGTFIVSALLGVLAVLCALLGILFADPISYAGKVGEALCLLVIFWFMFRSRRYDWRSQWLSLRQLERYIEQAAWLLLLGRSRDYVTPAHLSQFQTDDIAVWTNTYFRALIRNCSFPTARFTPDYLKTVHALALQNLVADQISYFREEAPFQHRSDDILERSTKACVLVAFGATGTYLVGYLGYLFLPVHLGMQHLLEETNLEKIVTVLGVLLTTTAAALSAMRSHGEYAQIAARFEGAQQNLQAIQSQLTALLPNRRPDFSPRPLRSDALAPRISAATDILTQEVQGWRAILQKKEIEPT